MIKKEELRTLFATLAKNDAKYWEDILTKAGVMTEELRKMLQKWVIGNDGFAKDAKSELDRLYDYFNEYGRHTTSTDHTAALYILSDWCKTLTRSSSRIIHTISEVGITEMIHVLRNIPLGRGNLSSRIVKLLPGLLKNGKYRVVMNMANLAIILNTISDTVIAAAEKEEKEASRKTVKSNPHDCVKVPADPDGIIKDILLYQDGSATFKIDTVNLLNYVQDQIPGDMVITKDSAQELMLALNKIQIKAVGGVTVEDSMNSIETELLNEHNDRSCSGGCNCSGKQKEGKDIISDITNMFKDLGIDVRVFNLSDVDKKHKDNYTY